MNREFFYVTFIPLLFLWTEKFCLHNLRSSEIPNIFDSYSHSLCCKQITPERDIWWLIQDTEKIDQRLLCTPDPGLKVVFWARRFYLLHAQILKSCLSPGLGE